MRSYHQAMQIPPTRSFNDLANPFRSFWMGGYECADHQNVHGSRVNLLKLSGHLSNIDNDYALLKRFNIHTVREGICWSMVEKVPYEYDFSHLDKVFQAGRDHNIQQVWDICHFGYPDDLTPFHPHFKARFIALSLAFGRYCLEKYGPADPIIITPVNEVSFISWLGGEAAATSPYCTAKGWDVKYALMGAYIAAVDRLKQISSRFIILATEPLVNIVAPYFPAHNDIDAAVLQHEQQYQAIDMLCGRICPELGGRENFLDIMGCNYYYTNQFSVGHYEVLPWTNPFNDQRWRPLSDLLKEIFHRYQKPLILAETSHPGIDRPNWLNSITEECSIVINENIPLWGICLYPIVDRPDWDDITHWHNSGLWGPVDDFTNTRLIYDPYALALDECQLVLFNM